MANEEKSPICNVDTVCEILDKLTLKQLHLLEDKMKAELNIESSINNGSFHLAKSRYIMGQSSVSATRLPMESSAEFLASTKCETVEEDGCKQMKVIEQASESTVNPLRWFGVLVPQNMHKAQAIFQNAINYVVECVNIQLQIQENAKSIRALQMYKETLQSN